MVWLISTPQRPDTIHFSWKLPAEYVKLNPRMALQKSVLSQKILLDRTTTDAVLSSDNLTIISPTTGINSKKSLIILHIQMICNSLNREEELGIWHSSIDTPTKNAQQTLQNTTWGIIQTQQQNITKQTPADYANSYKRTSFKQRLHSILQDIGWLKK